MRAHYFTITFDGYRQDSDLRRVIGDQVFGEILLEGEPTLHILETSAFGVLIEVIH